jgi:uncharacterized protein (TIGR00251 family)
VATGGVKPLDDGCALAIKVTPRASKNAIEPPRNDRLIVRVTAAPTDGDANAAVLKLLAKALGVPKTSMEISAGASGREKSVRIHGADAASIENRLTSYFEKR